MSMFGDGAAIDPSDLAGLRTAAQNASSTSSLWLCERFRIPIFALALKETNNIESAQSSVEPVLSSLCRRLVAGEVLPDDWSAAVLREVEACCAAAEQFDLDVPNNSSDGGDADGRPASQFATIPRIARRRAIAVELSKLDRPELMGVLMRTLDGATDIQIAGLVDDNLKRLGERLEATEKRLRDASPDGCEDLAAEFATMIRIKSPRQLMEAIQDELPRAHELDQDATIPLTQAARLTPKQLDGNPILFLLIGLLLGIVLGNLLKGSATPSTQQMLIQQMLMGGGRMARVSEQLLQGGLGGAAGFAIPVLTNAAKTCFFVLLILWAARTQLWGSVFGSAVPKSLGVARLMVLIAATMGVVNVVMGLYAQLIVMPVVSSRSFGRSVDLEWVMSLRTSVFEIWSLAFWLTAFLLFFTFVQSATYGIVRRRES